MADRKRVLRLTKRTLVQASVLAGLLALAASAAASFAAGAGLLATICRACLAFAGVAGSGTVVLPKLAGVILGNEEGKAEKRP